MTAETAVTLPVLLLVVLAGLGAVDVASVRLRCADAAAVAARLAARGEPADRVRDSVLAVTPKDAQVSYDGADPEKVTVVVRASVTVPVLGRLLPAWHVRESFTEPREPGSAQ